MKVNKMSERSLDIDTACIGSIDSLEKNNKNIIYDHDNTELLYVWSNSHNRIFKVVGKLNYHNGVGDTHSPSISVDTNGYGDIIDIPANNSYNITCLPERFNYIMYMKRLLSMSKVNLKTEYKKNKEFNSEDYYIFEDWRLFVSNVEKYNGVWYTTENLKFKADTIPCVCFNDIKDRRVKVSNTNIQGTIKKCLSPLDVGIIWDQGKKEYLPNFWNNINDLKFI